MVCSKYTHVSIYFLYMYKRTCPGSLIHDNASHCSNQWKFGLQIVAIMI